MKELSPETSELPNSIRKTTKKWTRAGTSKARTGCLSCKKRHVKCDERKEGGCLQCERFGCTCDGYATSSVRKSSSKRPTPKTWAVSPRVVPPFFQQTFYYEPSTSLFASDRDHHYYLEFCSTVAPRISGYPDDNLWNHLFLQACESDEAIRYVAVAIAALKTGLDARRSAETPLMKKPTKDVDNHQVFAFRAYDRALQVMQKEIHFGKHNIRNILIFCLVGACFEMHFGDYCAAAKHIVRGVSLLKTQIRPGVTNPPVEDEIIHAIGELNLGGKLLAPRIGISELKDSAVMESVAMTHLQARSIAVLETFTSLRKAEVYYQAIARSFLDWCVSVCVMAGTRETVKLDILFCKYDICVPTKHIAGREERLGEMRIWHKAFAPLLKQALASQDKDRKLFVGACSLQLLYLTGYFSAAVIRDSSKPYPDTRFFMPLFVQIVTLAKAILECNGTGTSVFTFETQVVAPLYTVALRCPHRAVRREAIDLMFRYPRIEGFWRSYSGALIAQWIMSLEEEHTDVDSEFIPDRLRCKDLKHGDYDLMARKCVVTCQIPSKDGKQYNQHELVVAW